MFLLHYYLEYFSIIFDINLYQHVANNVSIPIIASGGMGKSGDAVELIKNANVDAIAIASTLHYRIESIQNIKRTLVENKIKVRL